MDAAFDPSYEAWDVGNVMLLPAVAVVAPAAPAVIDSSYLLFNAAAMLAQDDVAVGTESSGAGAGEPAPNGAPDIRVQARVASPARAAPLPEAEATTEATAVAIEATASAKAATLAELSSHRPSLVPAASGPAASAASAAVSCANRTVGRSTPPEPPSPPPPRPVPLPSLQSCSSVAGAQRVPGMVETHAATQGRGESCGHAVDEEEVDRGGGSPRGAAG